MNIKKTLIGTAAGAVMILATTIPAFASTPPAAVTTNTPNACWDHGTFQYLQNGQNGGQGVTGTGSFIDGTTLSQDAVADGGMGAETGPANSASCQ